jgi:hypothetical protein
MEETLAGVGRRESKRVGFSSKRIVAEESLSCKWANAADRRKLETEKMQVGVFLARPDIVAARSPTF